MDTALDSISKQGTEAEIFCCLVKIMRNVKRMLVICAEELSNYF
jgi:hypothetical protein